MITAKQLAQHRVELALMPGNITIHTDAPQSHGGLGEYPTPVVLFAESLAACALTTLGMAAAKAGLNPEGYHAEVTDITTDDATHSVTAIAITFHLPASIEEKARKRLETFTHKGCMVGNSIKAEEQFTFVYE